MGGTLGNELNQIHIYSPPMPGRGGHIIDRCINSIHIYLILFTCTPSQMQTIHSIEQGKAIMKTRGTNEFSQSASYAYNALAPSKKEKLRGKCSKLMQLLIAKNIKQNCIKYSKTLTNRYI